jgi:hypothetical protein
MAGDDRQFWDLSQARAIDFGKKLSGEREQCG